MKKLISFSFFAGMLILAMLAGNPDIATFVAAAATVHQNVENVLAVIRSDRERLAVPTGDHNGSGGRYRTARAR